MALLNCPECGKEIYDKAWACPYCGRPTSGRPSAWAKVLRLALIAVLAAGAAAVVFWLKTGEARPETIVISRDFNFEIKKSALKTMGGVLGLRMLCRQLQKDESWNDMLTKEWVRVRDWLIDTAKYEERPQLLKTFTDSSLTVMTNHVYGSMMDGFLGPDEALEKKEGNFLKNCEKFEAQYERYVLE